MKKITLISLVIIIYNYASAQIVTIPDANFKAYLVGNTAINTNADTEIQVSEAAGFTGTIDCNGLSISDLTGIEAFTALNRLYCHNNQLTSLDISSNVVLDELWCYSNQLTSLTISNVPALTELRCHTNQLTSLDVSNNINLTRIWCYTNNLATLNLSANTALIDLRCYTNQLTNLDVSTNTALTTLVCSNNQLMSLDVSTNTALTDLQCYNNQLTSLDITNNTALILLRVYQNQLTSLDVSNNIALLELSCYVNQLTSLDVSSNSSLIKLRCNSNQLENLNVANGNNTNLPGGSDFNATNNPNLSCIQVDDVAYSIANWTNIDTGVSFDTNCTVLVSSITVQGQGGINSIITSGGTLQMEAVVLPLNANDNTYTWSVTNGTGSASIDSGGLLTAITDGTVTVTATANDASNITGDATITISNQSLGINEQTAEHNIFIYPNPVKSNLNIDSDVKIETIMILDVMGKTAKAVISDNNTIDVTDLSSGIYFLQVQTDKGLANIKFIKK